MTVNIDIRNQYANTYCMAVIPGGITGSRTCDKRIPVTEKYCEDCKKRMSLEKQKPATGA